MKVQRSFLRSSVARRIFLLFFLSALIPAAIIAWLSFREVQGVLLDQKRAELANLSKASSMAIYERLLLVEDLLRQLQLEGSDQANPSSSVGSAAVGKIYSLAVIHFDQKGSADAVRSVPAVPAPGTAQRRHLDAGKTLLIAVGHGRETARVFMMRSSGARTAAKDFLLAQIDPDFLWGDASDMPYGAALYVVGSVGQIFYSSRPVPAALLEALAQSSVRTERAQLEWSDDHVRYLGGYYGVMLSPAFQVDPWTFVVAQRESEVFASAFAFAHLFLPVLGLAILLVVLFSAIQIRRTMVPLKGLIDGTRRIASKEFDTRIAVTGADEFGTLARSFNDMADRLGTQFLALTTLSDIDHVILSTMDVDRVLDMVLDRLRAIVPVDFLCITVMDYDNPQMGHSHIKNYLDSGEPSVQRTQLTTDEHDELLAAQAPFWCATNDSAKAYVKPLAACHPSALLVLPVAWKNSLAGIVTLGYRDRPALSDDELAHACEFRDRIAVALSSASRDERLYYQARYDALTTLPNRIYFKDHLAQELAKAARDESCLAVLFMDLDHFKNVNDTAGHPGGDALLQEVAARMKATVRKSDFVARLGGDEFTVLMPNLATPEVASRVADKLVQAMATPFVVAGQERFLGASVGIAVYPTDGMTADDLIKNADTAMYRAKTTGRNRCVYFEERMNTEAVARVAMEHELRRAIVQEEFELYYQPKVATRSGMVIGAEALVRWHHPQRGLVSPVYFIGLAEEFGLIDSLGRWILATACKQFKSMTPRGFELGQISVNVSASQFKQKDFAAFVKNTLEQTSVRADSVELEITESSLMSGDIEVGETLDKLKTIGVSIALDDFGTGYSSLSYLKHFPIDVVKIDRSFVKDLESDTESAVIATAIIAMAHALGLKVVAEGVETEGQLAMLRTLNCDVIQGYYFAQPLPYEEFVKFVLAHDEDCKTLRSGGYAAR